MDKKPEKCKAGAPDWMVTYGDLVTLLMCFFVLLFAFSEIDVQKFEAVMQSFKGSAGILEAGKSLSEDQLLFDAAPENDTSPITEEVRDLQIVQNILKGLKDEFEKEFKGSEFEKDIEVEIIGAKLVIRLGNNILFDSARADLKTDAFEVIEVIGKLLKGEKFQGSSITIEGHTDDLPIHTLRFPSNWELSTARAISVLLFLEEHLGFEQGRLSVAGYADNRPIDTNATAEGRSRNRRVEISIENIIVSETDENNIEEPTEEPGDFEDTNGENENVETTTNISNE